jgi:hypothetical protein
MDSMNKTLEKRILTFAFLVLTLTIAVNTGFNIEGFRRDYRDGIILRCQSLSAGLQNAIENVLALGLGLEEMGGINLRCQEIVATDPEIIYCLIENAVGTPLYSSDPSFYFTAGVEFVSALSKNTSILNFPHLGRAYDVSQPVYDADGKLAGRIRIGFPESILEKRTAKVFHRSMIILGIAFSVVFGLVVLFAKRDLIGPIGGLCSMAKSIAAGDFKVTVPAMSTRDFSDLATALQEMASSLQSRDQKIRENYHELEETNLQLQESYEYQERIGAELGRSREMYRSLLEGASDAIVVSDDNDRIVLINRAAEAFFGIAFDRVEGMNLFSAMEMLKVDHIEEQYGLHRAVLEGETAEAEVSFVRPGDQRLVVGWIVGSPVVGKDGKHLVQATIRDITKEKEIKENLEKSTRELQRLNQMKDSFLGVASHELKTPLTVIIGYAELIISEMSGRLDESVLGMVQHIADAGERLSSIVRDMVDVSMLDNNRLYLRNRAVDINDVIRKAVTELEFFFSLRKQSFEFRLDDDLPPVLCDPDRLVQVVTNLVGNAIKFTPDEGTVTVETRRAISLRTPYNPAIVEDTEIKPIGNKPISYVEIIITDTGIGIAEADQIHIFDKFYEVGNIEEHFTGKVAFKGKGTGLGLAIVKGIIDMLDGEIWVESPGCDPERCPGSAFHILLPIEGPGIDDSIGI